MCRNKRNLKKEQRNNKMIELKGKSPMCLIYLICNELFYSTSMTTYYIQFSQDLLESVCNIVEDDGQKLVAAIVTSYFNRTHGKVEKNNLISLSLSDVTSIVRVGWKIVRFPSKAYFPVPLLHSHNHWNDKKSAFITTFTKSYQLRFAIAWQSIRNMNVE